MAQVRLKDMDLGELQDLMTTWGEKRFHGKQIFSSLFKRGVNQIDQMTDLPQTLREQLKICESLELLTPFTQKQSNDGTIKVLFKLKDNAKIESVYMPDEHHATVCLSTQVGCPLACTFCATGKMGFKRNLTSGEIVDQVVHFRRMSSDSIIRNLVFMGMGEPLLNYDSLVKAIIILSSEHGPAISQRRMTVSTAGVVPGIEQLAHEGLKVKLAVSLNASTNDLRDQLMPINKRYPIETVIDAAIHFQQLNGFRITFEYALMPGINDTPQMIRTLREWLVRVPSKLNLIPLNPIDRRKRKPADWDAIFDRFYEVFEKEKITLTLRRSRGVEILAACGQLAGESS